MGKSSLDAADLRILDTLQRNGRLSNVDLAEAVGLSPSPCLRRVKDLEDQGYIQGYAAILDRRLLGLGVVAFVEVKIDQNAEGDAVFRRLVSQIPEVVSCFVMTGTMDYLVQVVVSNLEAFAEVSMKKLLQIPGVKDVRSSFVLDVVKHSTAVPLPSVAELARD
ncbi:Lrp/AsnC family transcriptional regulator [Nitrospirillum sp. BR 11163]|uniref:Lrp/AsnC family transcriptional regulator n=1 Tax=Nitrospirillum sp. BR 11163 TaxID=3104323 RepID=UPI002AFF6A82|nr:Lrp/AsnC family transcriptional regulator [Nitrospirillum sp. BR 11163]MEA1675352.1 Lrp/AsnC family transcriptional regulator [Nitrospirillum sp. BR 11163]